MKRLTISDVVAMESKSSVEDKRFKKTMKKMHRNYVLSQEGMFDFFRKRKSDSKDRHMTGSEGRYNVILFYDKNYVDPKIYKETLLNANKVYIYLYTISVDEEIKLLEELIYKGLPLFQKDVERLEKCFNFIKTNKTKTIDKLDKFVDICYLDSSYKYNSNIKALDFSTFLVSVHGMAATKELQKEFGASHEIVDLANCGMDIEGKYPEDMTKEEISRYEKMYFMEEAMPWLDEIVPRKMSSASQKSTCLEKGDPKLKVLVDLNIELIEKSYKILSEYDYSDPDGGGLHKLWKLASQAENACQVIDMSDDFGFDIAKQNFVRYQSSLAGGFRQTFINNYIPQ